MNQNSANSLTGALLVVAGIILLSMTLGLVTVVWTAIWAILFGLAGLGFLALSLGNRDRWWAIIPGFALLGLGLTLGLETLAPTVADQWAGSLFLATLGLAFVGVFFVRREMWWAIIPAGTLLTLALVAGLDRALPGPGSGAIFLLGLGVTFGVVYLVPGPKGRQGWALIPAGILVLLGAVTSTATKAWMGAVGPLLLIGFGGYLVYRSMSSRREPQ